MEGVINGKLCQHVSNILTWTEYLCTSHNTIDTYAVEVDMIPATILYAHDIIIMQQLILAFAST